MIALEQGFDWKTQYEKGITYWRNQVPGLALLYQLHLANYHLPPELVGDIRDIKMALGLGYLASNTPHDSMGSHLSAAHKFILMGYAVARLDGADDISAQMFRMVGDSMLMLQPDEPLENKLANIKHAYTVVGQRGSGKGTVLECMQAAGVSTAASSRGLRETARVLLKRDATTPELVELGQKFKEALGFDIFIKMVLWQMTCQPSEFWEKIAIDGLRTDQELDIFLQLFGNRAKIIGIIRPATQTDQEAWQVVQERQKKSGKIEYTSFEQFAMTQKLEREKIDRLLKRVDVIIENDDTVQALEEKVSAILT